MAFEIVTTATLEENGDWKVTFNFKNPYKAGVSEKTVAEGFESIIEAVYMLAEGNIDRATGYTEDGTAIQLN